MNRDNSVYLNMRPYRRDVSASAAGRAILPLMERRFRQPFDSYWEQFGYEIGGPVCCAYAEWLSGEIIKRPEITDVAFIARDGWLIKQIYERMALDRAVKTHYVYAPRTLALRCKSAEKLEEYKAYLGKLSFGDGAVAVVDTVTMKFSSQRLLSMALPNPTIGLYWLVLRASVPYHDGFDFVSFQKEDYHTIRCWNLMEFIMTSPEPSICGVENGRALYRTETASERERRKMFGQIESGVLAFAAEWINLDARPEISNEFITQWVNAFSEHPDKSDAAAFRPVMISEKEDHSDQVPLDPFLYRRRIPSAKELKDRLWLYSQRHARLYRVLHRCNMISKEIIGRLHGSSYLRYYGENAEKLAAVLERYDVVSFDVFDTLVLRPLKKPTDLFATLENQNAMEGFHDNRIRAEADARYRSNSGEVDIYDIYEMLAPIYGQDQRELAQREIREELRVCYANEALTTLYRILAEKGTRMIAVSDMYLPETVLRMILDNCGFSAIRQIFVSCDYKVGKAGGALQRKTQDMLGSDLRYIHIGDNAESDVRGSIAAGWDAVLYVRKEKKRI